MTFKFLTGDLLFEQLNIPRIDGFCPALGIRDVKEHFSKLQYEYFLRWLTTERNGKSDKMAPSD